MTVPRLQPTKYESLQKVSPTICGSEFIPTRYNPYKYKDLRIVKRYKHNEYILWIKSTMRYCSCGIQTPYVYKKSWYRYSYRICSKCMPREIKEIIKGIYN